MTEKIAQGSASGDDEPKCDKCGAPITTGLMAAYCPAKKDCEFWVPELDEFMAVFKGA